MANLENAARHPKQRRRKLRTGAFPEAHLENAAPDRKQRRRELRTGGFPEIDGAARVR